ncbi:MAG: LacI family DNA-binding transcriptional regulator [Bauldia sp.]|nr:LacI family DNA-binding transcriptional regulator [Bauldia sp.]
MKRRTLVAGQKPRITLRDLARDLDLSVATVSRAFHQNADIAKDTRREVLERAAALGYRPNPLARSLITKQTHIAGIVAADITNPFYPEVLNQLTEALQTEDMNVMLVSASPSRSSDEALRLLLRYQPDIAILLAATLTSAAARDCREAGTPVIFFNRYVSDGESWAVTCDNVDGGRQIADRLIDQGHKRLAYVAGRPDASTTVDRWEGFSKRCIARGVAPPLREDAGAFGYEAGYEAAKRLLARTPRPDAVFGANDIVALGVVDAARREFGLRVPDDLSVAGFDDIAMASWPSYSLTTVRQPVAAMVESTVDIVRKIRQHPRARPKIVRLSGTLMERDTTWFRSEG